MDIDDRSEPDSIVASGALTEEELVSATRSTNKANPNVRNVRIAAGVFVAILIAVNGVSGGWAAVVPMLISLAVVLIVLRFIVTPWSIRRNHRTQPTLQGELRFTITENAVAVETAHSTTITQRSTFASVDEFEEFFLLRQSAQLAQIIPHRFFRSEADLAHARSMLCRPSERVGSLEAPKTPQVATSDTTAPVPIVVTGTLTEDDAVRSAVLGSRGSRRVRILSVGVAMVWALMGLLIGGWQVAAVFAGLYLLLWAMLRFVSIPRMARRHHRTSVTARSPLRIAIGEDGVDIESAEGSRTTTKWTGIRHVVEHDDDFLIAFSSRLVQAIPKRFFASETDLATARAIFIREGGLARPASSREAAAAERSQRTR